jgi:hypothetical protein
MAASLPAENNQMTNTRSNAVTGAGWEVSFWFAVLSPIIGVLLGLLAPFLIYH